VIRFTTAAVVCAVAAVAAVVSYSHIYGLGRAHGQDGTAARLLPLSVDGLILAASLVLLHEARNDRDAPRLARLMLWLGIGATIGANIAFGAGYGLSGALISAWPAVAFIGSVVILSFRVSRGCDLRRPVVDGVADGCSRPHPCCFTPLDRYLIGSVLAAGHRVRRRAGGGAWRSRPRGTCCGPGRR